MGLVVTKKDEKMKFKIGDKVIFGDKLDGESEGDYWIASQNLSLVADEEFKVGDKVQLEHTDGDDWINGTIEEKPKQPSSINIDDYYYVRTDMGDFWAKPEHLRLAASETNKSNESCSLCGGTGRIELFTSFSDCECQNAKV